MPTVTLRATPEDRRVAAYAALGVVIHVIEAGFPSPLPGVKPGLANVVTLIALRQFGWRTAAWISVLRVLVGALVTGSLLSPGFFLSAAGAVGALLALGFARGLPGIGSVGLSVCAALAHSASQFGLAYVWFIPHPALLHFLPVLLSMGLIFGLVSGTLADRLLRQPQTT